MSFLPRWPTLLACLAGSLLALLLLQLATGGLGAADAGAEALLAPQRSAPVLAFFGGLTHLGDGNWVVLAALPASAVLLRTGHGRLAAGLWLSLAGAGLTTWALKHLVARPRPEVIEGLAAWSPSFPSSHATAAMAAYAFLAYAFAPRAGHAAGRAMVWCVAALLVAGVGFSRVLLGLHHMTDVVAGLLVGLFWVSVAAGATRRRGPRSAGRPRTAGDPAVPARAAETRNPGAGSSGASHSAPRAPGPGAPAGA